MSKINRGIWCPRRVALNVKEGQCSGRKGPGKGRSPVAARASLPGSGARGGGLSQRLRPPVGPRRLQGYGPASWPVSRLSGGRSSKLNAPFLDPRGHQRTCTGGRDRSPEERRNWHITAAVMRLHSL